ncbi:Lrp/AsnC ligand binding domain-containing protein [Nitrosopumilus sp.]|nr:Lrp/AsnC ligand binding domain-containing protein [Nitrosopumilus sp.]
MTIAYVLVNVTLGKEEEVIQDIQEIAGVTAVDGVFGAYDILVRVEVDDVTLLRDLITSKIRKISTIRSTLVLIVVEGQDEE